jgi:hypothetical protein
MKVARQFTAWNVPAVGSRPVGYGLISLPQLVLCAGPTGRPTKPDHTVPYGTDLATPFPGNKLPGYFH